MPRPRINPERPLTAAERKRRQREKQKREAKEQMRAEFEGKIKAQGYSDVREFMRAQEEDIKAFALGESSEKLGKGKEYVGGGKPEMKMEELDFRKASGLSEAYKLTKELKREALRQKKTLTTIIELTAYGKTETYLLIVAPTGKLQWKKIAEKEEEIEEDIPTEVRSKWIGAKGI